MFLEVNFPVCFEFTKVTINKIVIVLFIFMDFDYVGSFCNMVTFITLISETFMIQLYMPVDVTLLCGGHITLIAIKSLIFMDRTNMIFQIWLCCSLVITKFTIVPDSLMYSLNVSSYLFLSIASFVITFSTSKYPMSMLDSYIDF